MNRVQMPRFVQSVFSSLRGQVSKPQFTHLWTAVLALLVNRERTNLRHMARTRPYCKHRTSLGWFLSQSDWQAERLLRLATTRLLRSMRPQRGEFLYLLLDDTRIAKRGQKMAWLSKIWDHTTQRFVRGHFVVTAAVSFRGVTLPWCFRLWAPKNTPGIPYRKSTDIVADIIRSFGAPKRVKVRVLFDAFYLCPTVVRACEERDFNWFSVAARNRKFSRLWGKTRSIAELGPGVLRHEGKRVRLRRARGWAWMRIAAVDGWLSRIGPVRLVFSKRPTDPWKKTLAIATDEMDLPARTIITVYERRWAIEVLFKELKGELGLSDYQVISPQAILRHLHLCGLAHLVLTHHSLDAVGAQARKANEQLHLSKFQERLREFRDALQRDHLCRVVRRTRDAKIRRLLQKKLRDLSLAA